MIIYIRGTGTLFSKLFYSRCSAFLENVEIKILIEFFKRKSRELKWMKMVILCIII